MHAKNAQKPHSAVPCNQLLQPPTGTTTARCEVGALVSQLCCTCCVMCSVITAFLVWRWPDAHWPGTSLFSIFDVYDLICARAITTYYASAAAVGDAAYVQVSPGGWAGHLAHSTPFPFDLAAGTNAIRTTAPVWTMFQATHAVVLGVDKALPKGTEQRARVVSKPCLSLIHI